MTLQQIAILLIAAFLGGTLNAVAGGGSFITFPALVVTGVPSISANATSTVVLWPGSIASIGAYRRELAKQSKPLLFLLGCISLIGGILGAYLLLHTSQSTFERVLPYLLLTATLLFTFSGRITALLRSLNRQSRVLKEEAPPDNTASSPTRLMPSKLTLVGIACIQLIIATYGGYFGGGIGILMLATLGLLGMENSHEMNAIKALLASLINGTAVITFIIAGKVVWLPALIMFAGATLGGYLGAYFARKLDQRWIRGFVILVGFSMTIYFFIRL